MAETNVNTGTPYDDAFRTILTECKELIIPVVNEVFGTNFSGKEPITVLSNERFLPQEGGSQSKRITDSYFEIIFSKTTYRYHLECQSSQDGTMIVRMFEYDAQIAAENAVISGNEMIVTFPESAVIYLRQTQNTPDEMKITIRVPNGEISYCAPVMKVQNYSLEAIFDKQLWFLLPFYIFRFEKRFSELENSEAELKDVQTQFLDVVARLNELVQAEKMTEFEKYTILDMSKKVLESLAANYSNVKKGVSAVMGGKILEYEARTIKYEGEALKTISLVERCMKHNNCSAQAACELMGCDYEEYVNAKAFLEK